MGHVKNLNILNHYLIRQKYPYCQTYMRKIANVQKCIRTCDIDEVGDLTHLTLFESKDSIVDILVLAQAADIAAIGDPTKQSAAAGS